MPEVVGKDKSRSSSHTKRVVGAYSPLCQRYCRRLWVVFLPVWVLQTTPEVDMEEASKEDTPVEAVTEEEEVDLDRGMAHCSHWSRKQHLRRMQHFFLRMDMSPDLYR